MKRYFLLLVILIILGGGSPLPGQEAPQVLLLSSSLDYFSTFLEVHLRRLLSPSRVHLIPLCSLEELSLGFPPEKAFLIVFLGEEKYFSSILSQIPQDKEPLLLFWEGVAPPLGFPSCKIRVEVEEVIEVFRREVVEKLFLDDHFTIWGVGKIAPPLRQGLNEEFYPRFREIEENDKDTLKQLISNREKSLIIAGNAEAGRQLIDKFSEVESPPPLVVLEASPEMLFALLQGKIEAVVDFKPSQLAQEIANLIDCFCANKPIPEFITIHPCLILPHSIEEADGYEVISRCLMCQ